MRAPAAPPRPTRSGGAVLLNPRPISTIRAMRTGPVAVTAETPAVWTRSALTTALTVRLLRVLLRVFHRRPLAFADRRVEPRVEARNLDLVASRLR